MRASKPKANKDKQRNLELCARTKKKDFLKAVAVLTWILE
jgi:hypothetical protein